MSGKAASELRGLGGFEAAAPRITLATERARRELGGHGEDEDAPLDALPWCISQGGRTFPVVLLFLPEGDKEQT